MNIKELKTKAFKHMNEHQEIRKEHIDSGGIYGCDYYHFHTNMYNYWRGMYNGCMELEKTD